MSANSTGIPPAIEQQLLMLDKQFREAAFVRGMGRLVCGACLLLGGCLLLDGCLDLNGPVRAGLLTGWMVISFGLLWHGLIRKAIQPSSFAALAAVVERQFPDLRERLTSLVELRGDEQSDRAPGASHLMQDLLARQTLKALDQISVDDVASTQGSARSLTTGFCAFLLLIAPFGLNSSSYGLLWSRFFAPWGNYAWGATLDVKVLEGDRIVARGADVDVHATISGRFWKRDLGKDHQAPIWLNWLDEKGASDSRRLEWDEENQQFVTVLPHVRQSLTFHVATRGAKSAIYRIDVSDPPVILQTKIEIDPAAYTGLPARSISDFPREIRVPEFTRLNFVVEFNEPVTTAKLAWPARLDEDQDSTVRSSPNAAIEQSIPLDLADDRFSASTTVTAAITGSFAVKATNQFGLPNNDPPHTLVVDLDRPPQIKLDGNEDSEFCRPDELVELPIDVQDDFGLTAVEFHASIAEGKSIVLEVPANERRGPRVTHSFAFDLSQLELDEGQVVTYRFRAIDNRPRPSPHVVWSTYRSLVVGKNSKQQSDQQLAREEQRLEDELNHLRTAVNKLKNELTELHQQTEKEAVGKQPEADKAEKLAELQREQTDLNHQIEQFADRLAERQMTSELATDARQIVADDLQLVNQKLENSKGQSARDQLEPMAQSIDHLGTADRKLRQLEQQLNELNKLEQDLAEMKRLAGRAERLAEQLEQLDTERAAPEELDRLKSDGQKIDEQMNELLKKHPELIDAARRDQLDRLDKAIEQAKQLVEPQERLAQALEESAKNSPTANSPTEENTTKAENADRKVGHDATEKQTKLARAATEQALTLARETGGDSEATKSATEFAQKADAARQQAQSGQLEKATKTARDAADAAEATARQLNPDGQSDSAQSQQAQKNADEQRQTAQQMEQVAQSPEARKGAQEQGQRQLAESANRLTNLMDRIAKDMKSKPIDSPKDAEASEQAKQTMQQAEQAMAESQQANRQNDMKKAANEAKTAAENLKKVASTPKQSPPSKPCACPVPKEVGSQVAEAKQCLDAAQMKLSQCNCNKPGSRQGQSGQGQSNSGEASSDKPGSGKSGHSTSSQGQSGQQDSQGTAQAKSEQQSQDASQGQSEPQAGSPEQAQSDSNKNGQAKPNDQAQASAKGQSTGESTGNAVAQQSGHESKKASEPKISGEKPTEGQQSSSSGQARTGSSSGDQNGEQSSSPSEAAGLFRKLAAMLKQRGQIGQKGSAMASQSERGKNKGDSNPEHSDPDQQKMASNPGEEGSGGNGADATADLSQLNAELQQQARQNWGRLPGKLRTEILQGAGKKTHPEYTQQIKSYFDEITKPK